MTHIIHHVGLVPCCSCCYHVSERASSTAHKTANYDYSCVVLLVLLVLGCNRKNVLVLFLYDTQLRPVWQTVNSPEVTSWASCPEAHANAKIPASTEEAKLLNTAGQKLKQTSSLRKTTVWDWHNLFYVYWITSFQAMARFVGVRILCTTLPSMLRLI